MRKTKKFVKFTKDGIREFRAGLWDVKEDRKYIVIHATNAENTPLILLWDLMYKETCCIFIDQYDIPRSFRYVK